MCRWFRLFWIVRYSNNWVKFFFICKGKIVIALTYTTLKKKIFSGAMYVKLGFSAFSSSLWCAAYVASYAPDFYSQRFHRCCINVDVSFSHCSQQRTSNVKIRVKSIEFSRTKSFNKMWFQFTRVPLFFGNNFFEHWNGSTETINTAVEHHPPSHKLMVLSIYVPKRNWNQVIYVWEKHNKAKVIYASINEHYKKQFLILLNLLTFK